MERTIRACGPCAARATGGKQRKANLRSFVVTSRFSVIAADILGPVTTGGSSKAKHILVMTDMFTKYVVTTPLINTVSQTVAQAIVETWILRFGVPDTLHTDQGTNFNSLLIKELCKLLKIDKSRTTAYHPEGNGQVERFNRVIADTISKYCARNPRDWDTVLPFITIVYNTSVHRTTGVTPFSLTYGEECEYLIGVFYLKPPEESLRDSVPFIEWLDTTFREIH